MFCKSYHKGNRYMRNILVTICYDGSNYHGWQIQKNALSVQEVFQTALYKIIGEKVDIKGCSRTDSGVHANMYAISFKTNHNIACKRLVAALNRYLPLDIAALDAKEVSEDFHARYSAKGKEYIYKIWNEESRNPFLNKYSLHYWYNLDEEKLNRAAQAFVGRHDFTSFCTLDARKMGDMVRTIEYCNVYREGPMVFMKVKADGFLYNMVKIMVGTLLKVAQGKIQEEDIPYIIEAKNRQKAGPKAQAQGLYLNKVFYEEI